MYSSSNLIVNKYNDHSEIRFFLIFTIFQQLFTNSQNDHKFIEIWTGQRLSGQLVNVIKEDI